MSRTITPAAILASVLAFGGAAYAQSPVIVTAQGVRAVTVDYGDLNLAAEPGARAMLARIEAAAGAVCGPAPVISDLATWSRYKACTHESIGSAVRQVNAPLVAALYAPAHPKILARK